MTKKRRKLFVTVAVGLVAAGTVLTVGRFLGTPSEGSIQTPPPADAQSTAVTQRHYSGKYIAFSYPSLFTSGASQKPGGNILETVYLANYAPTARWDLNISVSRLPSGNLADDGSYNFRVANPARFKHETWNVKGQAIPVMVDGSGGFNEVAFIPHGNLIASLSLSCASTASAADLENNLKLILQNINWLQD